MDVFGNELPLPAEHHFLEALASIGSSLLGGGKSGGGSSSSTTTTNKNSYNTGLNGAAVAKIAREVRAAGKPAAQLAQTMAVAAAVLVGIFLWKRRK